MSFHVIGDNLADLTRKAVIRLNTFIAEAPVKDYSIERAEFEPETTMVMQDRVTSEVVTWRGTYTIRLVMDGES